MCVWKYGAQVEKYRKTKGLDEWMMIPQYDGFKLGCTKIHILWFADLQLFPLD